MMSTLRLFHHSKLFNASPIYFIPLRGFKPDKSTEKARESRFLKKFMVGTSKNKKKFYNVDMTSSKVLKEFQMYKLKEEGISSSFTPKSSPKRVLTGKPLRRQETLNNIFMKEVSSLMSTGEVGVELIGKGIQITDVRVANDFNFVNIYWATSGAESDDVIEENLKNVSHDLRREMCSRHIIGIVPPFQFVKDRKRSMALEVERRIALADMGPDHVPLNKGELEKTLNILDSSKLRPEVWQELKDLEGSEEEDLEEVEEMRNDVLGIPYNKIMQRIKLGMEKVEKLRKSREDQAIREARESSALETLPKVEESLTNLNESETPQFMEAYHREKFRSSELAKFLKAQRIAKEKEIKRMSTAFAEKEFLKTELETKLKEKYEGVEDEFHFGDYDQGDVYEEEVEEEDSKTFEDYSREER